jgi:hypothetical protein
MLFEACGGGDMYNQGFLSGRNDSMWVRMSISQRKKMPVTFFDIKNIVQFEFILQDQSVNQAYYVDILKRLCETVPKVSCPCA